MKQTLKKITIFAAALLTVGLIPNWEHQLKQLNHLQILGRTTSQSGDYAAAPELVALADNPQITAASALAYDHQSGSILFTYNFDKQLPVASLTKLLSALIVLDSGKVNDTVVVRDSDIKVIGANTGLVAGEQIRARELLKAMLIASHNDSTKTLARHVGGTTENFVDMMNDKARAIGLQNTHFTNPMGFDDADHYSNAQDMQVILRDFLSRPELSEIVKIKEAEISSVDGAYKHKIKTTNKLLLEDESVVGVKTGYTTEAKGNLVIRSVKGDADVITIVLGSDDREGDSRKILDWVYSVYRW